MGEHCTLGGFCPVLLGEKVIAGGSIRDYPKTPKVSVMNSSLIRLVRMVVAPAVGVRANFARSELSVQGLDWHIGEQVLSWWWSTPTV